EGKVVWLYVDFKKATEADEPRGFLYRELLSLIEADTQFGLGTWEGGIRPAYDSHIEKLKNGPLYNLFRIDRDEFDRVITKTIMEERELVEPYVERILQYAGTKYPV